MDSRKVLVACLLGILNSLHGTSGTNTWGYFGEHGPSNWHSISATCNGNSQSPINIDPTTARMDTSMPAFRLSGFDSNDSVSLTMLNNGHTAQLNIGGSTMKVSGGGLPAEYTAAQLHFHWGKTDNLGSEHTFMGRQYPMEMHIVTYKTSYGGLGEAIQHPDGLAVLGFFFEIGNTEHPGFKTIVDALPHVGNADTTHAMAAFKIRELMPSTFPDFYRYSGSLTTPTCNEVVTWTVFTETIKITSQQMAAFRSLEASETNDVSTNKMYNNFRSVQQLNGRTVKANFDPSTGFRPSSHFSLLVLTILAFLLTHNL